MNFLAATDPLVSFLVFVAIVVVSAISNWLKRKNAEREAGKSKQAPAAALRRLERSSSSSPQETPTPPKKAARWEEEIRRLLEQATREPERPQPEAVPLPPASSRPMVLRETQPRPAPLPKAPPPLTPLIATTPAISAAEMKRYQEKLRGRLAYLDQSASAFQRASRLSQDVRARLKHADTAPDQARREKPRERPKISPEIQQVLLLFRNPRSARQALVASVVFNQPKALEQP